MGDDADRSEREARFLEQLGMALADSDQCARVIQKLDDRIEEFYKFTPLQRESITAVPDFNSNRRFAALAARCAQLAAARRPGHC
jgi:hypothetical protein